MKYFRKIQGERLYLSPMHTDDVEIFTKWLNDPDVAPYLAHYSRMISLAIEKKKLEEMVTEGQNFAIVTNDDVLIGTISLMHINHINQTATVGLFIGEKGERGKGYGTEAMRLIVGFGFNTLNLQNIMLQVQADNEQAIASYKKCGFTEFGRRRKAQFKEGRFVDLIHMETLREEN